MTGSDAYLQLRELALSSTAEEFAIDLSPDQHQAYGVVIDIATEDGSATVAAFSTGDASMYTHPGGGIIGGIGHESVRDAAMGLVEAAGRRLAEMTPTEDTPLPPPGTARFFALTNRGKYAADVSFEDLFTPSQDSLIVAANALFTELREIEGSEE